MLRRRWLKAIVFLALFAPAAYLGWRFYTQDLGANPLEFITHFTGDWTIRFIAATLAITPLRKLLGLPDLIRFRRMIGLYAFFYGCLHFLAYLWFDKLFDFSDHVVGSRRHHGIEIARSLAVDEVAPAVAFPRFDEREIAAQSAFHGRHEPGLQRVVFAPAKGIPLSLRKMTKVSRSRPVSCSTFIMRPMPWSRRVTDV